jgi:hypothetical protein
MLGEYIGSLASRGRLPGRANALQGGDVSPAQLGTGCIIEPDRINPALPPIGVLLRVRSAEGFDGLRSFGGQRQRVARCGRAVGGSWTR